MAAPWGATRTDWSRAKKLAKRDLLPAVSDPTKDISPRSQIKQVGKLPSVLNAQGYVVGFADWTNHQTTVRDIETWQAEPAYGICIQTRVIRALDIDVPDKAKAMTIRLRFLELLDLAECPRRWRADSGKELLAFKIEGTGEELTKRSFIAKEWVDETTGKTMRWLVEFLAHGQQFIAAGTHPDGERYVWDGDGLIPEEVPTITLEVWEAAWAQLAKEFMAEGTEEGQRRAGAVKWSKEDEAADIDDEIADWLDAQGLVIHKGKDGVWTVACPWEDGHSGDPRSSATVWLCRKAGTRRGGVFDCKHAGCSCRSTHEYLRAVGYYRAGFEDLGPETGRDSDGAGEDEGRALRARPVDAGTLAAAAGREGHDLVKAYLALGGTLPANPKRDRMPGFERKGKDGNGPIAVNLTNLTRFVGSIEATGCEIAFDLFRGELMCSTAPGAWRPMTDADAVRLRRSFEGLPGVDTGTTIGKELMRDALDVIGDENQFDSAVKWLLHVVPAWDGVPRIHRFWPDIMKTKDTEYARELGNYTWTAQAARILDPGCKVDMVPVLVGEEGTRKSTAISLIAPHEDHFAEFNLGLEDEKLSRLMRGTLVGELAELRGISARDGEAVLAWITKRHEKWTPKFKEYAISLARRLVFYGTTNDAEFMQAHIGQRRWLPITILDLIDTDAIDRDRDQLWAEARDVYLYDGGIQFRRVEELAKAERAAYRYVDAWHDQIAKWLDESIDDDDTLTPRNCGTLTAEQVLRDCLGIDGSRIRKPDQQRVTEVLKALGMARTQGWVNKRNVKVWIDRGLDSGVGTDVTPISHPAITRVLG